MTATYRSLKVKSGMLDTCLHQEDAVSEFVPVLNVAVLDGSNGFRLDGDSAYD